VLRQENGYGVKKFVDEFPNRNWYLSSLLENVAQTSTVYRKPSSNEHC